MLEPVPVVPVVSVVSVVVPSLVDPGVVPLVMPLPPHAGSPGKSDCRLASPVAQASRHASATSGVLSQHDPAGP